MRRRKFIKEVAMMSAAGIAGSIPALKFIPRALAAERETVVGVSQGKDWSELVEKALEPLGGIRAFVKPGARVVVKPNASFDRAPDQGSNTHPQIMTAVLRLCLEADASEIIVVDRTLANTRRCWINSGLGPAVESMADDRITISEARDRDFVSVRIEKGVALGGWQFFKPALEADAYINLPVAKHHSASKLTLGLKNMLGILGGARQKIHWNLHQGIADLHTVIRPTLTVIDATRIIVRNGPGGGSLEDREIRDTVIASADTVAADAYAARTLFEMDPAAIDHIKIASQMGIGEMDLDRIKVVET